MNNQLKAQYDYWCNHHSDDPPVKQAWQKYEEYINYHLPRDMRKAVEERLQTYLLQLEYQAFSGSFSAGVLLMAGCLAANEKCPCEAATSTRAE